MNIDPEQDRLNEEQIVAEDLDFPPKGAERGLVDMSSITLNMVGHAHIDLAYRWDIKETVHRVAPWTFKGVLDLMERTPNFTFCQSQLFLYQTMEKEYPDLFSRIRKMIQKGTWEVIGGSWCEYDAILASGEAIIRQHLAGVRYAIDNLGVTEHLVAFFPDSFCGHAATLPQILAGCGFKYYIFGRGLPQKEDAPEKTRRAFRWIGPDGSSLIAYLPFGPYSTPPVTRESLETYLSYIKASVSNHELVLYGQGDHGGGPRDSDIDALRTLETIPGAPRWHFATIHGYCRQTFKRQVTDVLKTHRGNLGDSGSGAFRGALTSQARIKRRNRQLEREILFAEATAVVGTLLSRKPAFPRVDFQLLWQDLLIQQFHDVLPGTSVHAVYRDVHAVYDRIDERCARILEDNFCRIRSRIDTCLKGYPLIVYNPGLQPVKAVVDVDYPVWLNPEREDKGWKLTTINGKEIEAHFGDRRLIFAAELPSLGYRTLCLVPGQPSRNSRLRVQFKDSAVESPLFRLTFDMNNGNLTQAYDKRYNRPLLNDQSNSLELLEERGVATSWVHTFTGEKISLELVSEPQIVEENPFFFRIATTSKSRWSVFTREVIIYNEIERIDFRITVDWHEANAFLKVGFVPALSGPVVKAALAHGATVITQAAQEFCMHDWVDLNDGEWGMAFLNDGAYACNFEQGRLGISVMRMVRDMDPAMDQGKHELGYCLFPYSGKSQSGRLVQETGNFCHNLMCAFEPSHPGVIESWGRLENYAPIPPEHSFLGVDKPNVHLCAFKMPDENWSPVAFVVRLREVDGQATECRLTLPLKLSSVVESDHLERPGQNKIPFNGRQVHIMLRPHEIKTIIAYL